MTVTPDKKVNNNDKYADIHAVLRSEHIETSYIKSNISLDLFTEYVQMGFKFVQPDNQEKFSNKRQVELFKQDLAAFEKCIAAENSKKDPRSLIERIISTVLSLFGIQTSGEKTLQAHRVSVQNARETHRKVTESCNKFLQRSKEVQKPVADHSTSKPIKIRQSNSTPEKKEVNNSSNNSPTKTNNSPVTTNHQEKLPLENKVIAKKELSNEDKKFLQQIQAAISALDLGHTEFKTRINAVIESLELLPADFPKQELILALNTLKDSKAFEKNEFEERVINSFIPGSGQEQRKIHYSDKLISVFAQTARGDLLRFIKSKSKKGINELLSNVYNKEIADLKEKTLKNRLDTLIKDKIIFNNVLTVTKFLEKFEADFGKYIDEEADKIYSRYDARSNNKFSSLIKIYDYCDIKYSRYKLVKNETKAFLQILSESESMSQINQLKGEELSGQLERLCALHLDVCKENFNLKVETKYRDAYEWIVKNRSNIKKSHNQSKSEMLACYQNSLDRIRHLLIEPGSRNIEMKISAHGRKIRSQLNIDPNRPFDKKEIEKFGVRLSQSEVIRLPENTTMGQQVVKGISKINPSLLSKHHGLFILEMYKEESGHALNVQFDHSTKIYRFIDDNFGICEYNSPEEFLQEFQTYLNIFYPEYRNRFCIGLYDSIKTPMSLRQSK